jgi:hypothetical protein
MMPTDRGLDALTCPPIDAFNQTSRHPKSLPACPRAEVRHEPGATLPATVGERSRAVPLSRIPVAGSIFTINWLGAGGRFPSGRKPSRGACRNTSRSSVWVTGRRLPVRMKNGTAAHRQVCRSPSAGAVGLRRRSCGHSLDVEVAVVLAAHVMRRSRRPASRGTPRPSLAWPAAGLQRLRVLPGCDAVEDRAVRWHERADQTRCRGVGVGPEVLDQVAAGAR